MERISFSLRLLVLFLLKVNSNISLAQPNMSTPVIPVRPSPGFNILPPVMKICQASVCFANQEEKRRFEEANNCIFIKDPCEDLKENQCCGKDPKTGGKLAVDKQAQTINKNFDWQQYQKMCPEMKQSEAEPDALWRQCRVGQKHDPQDDYPIQIVEKNGNARTYCIDGCSTPPSIVAALALFNISSAFNKDNPSGHPQGSFFNACAQHDRCYQTCIKNSTQGQCDRNLLQDMNSACARIPVSAVAHHPSMGSYYPRLECYKASNAYYQGLVEFGQKAFSIRKQQYCSCC